jgi:DNA-binding NtrC family response regulator
LKINKKQLIIVVDDDIPLNNMICTFLLKQGFSNVKGFYTGEDMLNEVSWQDNPIVVQDFDLPGMNGLDIIKKVKGKHPKTEFIFLSGQSRIEVAVEAVKFGAYDYIVKDNFAKENTASKIRTLLKIKELIHERSFFKIGFLIFLIMLVFTWIVLFIFLTGK